MDNYHQKQLLALEAAQTRKMELVDSVSMRGVKSLRQAMALSIALSGNTHESIAENPNVHKRKEQISKFISGSSGLKGDDIENLINETGSLAVIQYLAKKYNLVCVDVATYEAMKNGFFQQMQAIERAVA